MVVCNLVCFILRGFTRGVMGVGVSGKICGRVSFVSEDRRGDLVGCVVRDLLRFYEGLSFVLSRV